MKKYYAVCPECGYRLLKGAEGTKLDIVCPKCHQEVVVIIENSTVQTKNVVLKK